jgi:hypothetical protein
MLPAFWLSKGRQANRARGIAQATGGALFG